MVETIFTLNLTIIWLSGILLCMASLHKIYSHSSCRQDDVNNSSARRRFCFNKGSSCVITTQLLPSFFAKTSTQFLNLKDTNN